MTEMTIPSQQKTEIIAVCSGKGGTGKTLLASCLGYALIRSGHKVLMIDGDPATSGLSLFLLGPKGMRQASTFDNSNTFVGLLQDFQQSGTIHANPRTIHRSASDDHGISYDAIICTNTLYGEKGLQAEAAVPDLDQSSFRAGIRRLFEDLRNSGEFSYVIVDTRGGFAFESTDVCALADSFIVVTEPTISSFYQDRNLVQRINQAVAQISSPSVLRAVVINKATDVADRNKKSYLENLEFSFRNELTKEFGIDYSVTHAIPADLSALHSYKEQKIPYVGAPGSMFSYATLSAFSDIVQVVTSRWSKEQVARWNQLIDVVISAIDVENKKDETNKKEIADREKELVELRSGRLLVERQLTSLREELEAKDTVRALERDKSYRSEVMQLTQTKTRKSWLVATGAVIVAALVVVGAFYIQSVERRNQAIQVRQEAAKRDADLLDTQQKLNVLQYQLSSLASSKTKSENLPSTPIPVRSSNCLSVAGNDGAGRFGVILSNDTDLQAKGPGAPSAIFEAQIASQLGCSGVTLYKNYGDYMTVVPFVTQSNATDAVTRLQSWTNGRWKTAYVRPLDSWCSRPVSQGTSTIKTFVIPVISCSPSSAKE
ncbi:ParA family protein [Granulicella arctica]|uniref:ParA family protein n=1 Tax=Granulicella arctica TaxID=940613 RepID=UPI0021DF4BE2|nr:ParA family protein [Granulicella arctica]